MLSKRAFGTRLVLLVLMLVLSVQVIQAQDDTGDETEESVEEIPAPIPTMTVEIEAEDGLSLYGDFYASPQSNGRAVLLLHELYTNRSSWRWVIDPLRANGYHVLAVDLRSWGDSRGATNWRRAQTDTQVWLTWLYEQPNVRDDRVFILGSSMGANLAMVGCADAEFCAGAVAISAGANYFGVGTSDALISGRPMLILYAERDSIPRRDVPRMQTRIEEAELSDIVSFISYEGRAHGMLLFDDNDDLIPEFIGWMNQR